ncbi:MAG: type I restriction enzyme HsdR N-terminal domain-containing protein [Bacteroidales bacterium]|jgi:predicted type IV restriction endonuclease|nr:type I restriction enzyme HsdR N-terminal domain-containing protein [Bacteroidales bacterium]MBP5419331.1 type I restriction enzyme HsdR N-terminal domain-containing protein [Bacteroidales bacterium]MCR5696488.1 type I restriction enzyme HsdR N-terminal domain-containing protein [Marinilabiliaceae bacterium]
MLNLPPIELRTRTDAQGRTDVFDPYRKRFVRLTPEEEVRQTFLGFLTNYLGYPAGRTAVEHPVNVNGLHQRADIVIFDKAARPYMVVECKAPHIKITQATFRQALRYNTQLGTRILVITNGMQHFCALLTDKGDATMLSEIPPYTEGKQ